jgi:hypothetical protein
VIRAADLVQNLGLQLHPEGGWYREVYRSPTRVDTTRGPRSALTTIYYLLERNQLSRWHVVQADEIWHFYGGAPLELLDYSPESRRLLRHRLGDIAGREEGATSVAMVAAGGSGDERPTSAATIAAGSGREEGPTSAPTVAAGDVTEGATTFVATIPAGIWQAARSVGDYTLVGCTVGPGFEFADFQFVSALPGHTEHFTGELSQLAALL